MKAIMDFLSPNGMGQGELATYLLNHGRIDANLMRPFVGEDGRPHVVVYTGGPIDSPKSYKVQRIQANATLRRDEWKQLDEAVLKIAETRLVGIQDLVDNGLVFNLGNAMGTTVLEYHGMSDALSAEVTMDGITRAPGDRPKFSTNYMPLPIIHADYEINARVLAASRNLGNSLDVTNAERAARKVAEQLENMLFTNTTFQFGGGTIYSYLNHPNRNVQTLALAWDNASKTAAQIVQDVLDMKQASINDRHYGPWVLYVPTAYEVVLDKDYTTSTNQVTTIRQRILAIEGIKSVKVIDTLPANTVLLVQMTSDVVRLVKGMPIQSVQWQMEGNMVTKYKVMTIQVPQVRSDDNNRSGIVHLS